VRAGRGCGKPCASYVSIMGLRLVAFPA
jgi:hypothetical protein